jgi:rare lipoprotein A
MKARILGVAALVMMAYGCATTAPPPKGVPEMLHGVASWYGEEFAGRTTANGEIFDPSLMTAAHRTLPFGTIVDITNPKTSQTVRVRVNDRGPYIGNRVIDLSYAAAQQISLIEPGVGEVDIKVVKVGNGDREPPAPFDVTIAEAPKTAPIPSAGDPPRVEFPLPAAPASAAPVAVAPAGDAEPVVVDRITVETQRGATMTRKQVSPDGRTIEDVPVGPAGSTTASSYDELRQERPLAPVRRSSRPAPKQFVVLVGAFAVEANAKSLQEKLTSIGQRSFIDHEELYRVRIGPFGTRDQALDARAAHEAKGLSAMIVAE